MEFLIEMMTIFYDYQMIFMVSMNINCQIFSPDIFFENASYTLRPDHTL
jgi:hypothetical protein